MTQPALEVATILRQYLPSYLERYKLTLAQEKVVNAIMDCRTEKLGGHLHQCQNCDYQLILFNSCRSRYCTKCQRLATAEWLATRQAELLPVTMD